MANFYYTLSNDIVAEHDVKTTAMMFGVDFDKIVEMANLKEYTGGVIELIQKNHIVYAIKMYRELHHCSLAEAKTMVDKIRDDMNKF